MAADESGSERLDAEKVEVLRRWGTGLATSGRDDELRAAGRAILLLCDELDRTNRELWHARAGVSDRLPGVAEEPEPDVPTAAPPRFPVVDVLTRRLRVRSSPLAE